MAECLGGTPATLQVVNTDCGCVSIKSIASNQAGTNFTITLDNGQSIAFTLPVAPATPAIEPEFRTSGTLLQYSIDGGTTWVTIYDLGSLVSVELLYNGTTDNTTTGTSMEVLDSYSIAANKLAAVQDCVEIDTIFALSTVASGSNVEVTFDGTVIATGVQYTSLLSALVVHAKVTRISATQVSYEANVKYLSSGSGHNVVREANFLTTIAGGIDFTAPLVVEASAQDAVAGRTSNKNLSILLL